MKIYKMTDGNKSIQFRAYNDERAIRKFEQFKRKNKMNAAELFQIRKF